MTTDATIGSTRRARRAVSAACSMAVALGAAASGHAQSRPAQPAPTSLAGAGSGGASANRGALVLSVTDRADTNIRRVGTLQPNPSGKSRADMRITPAVDLDFARRLGQHQFAVFSSLGYDFYQRNTQLNRERFAVQPSLFLNLPVCDVYVNGAVSRQQSDLGELVYLGIDPTLNTTNLQTQKSIAGRLVCGGTNGLRSTFEAERSVGDNSNPLRRIANYRTTRLQPGISYSSPVLGEITAYAFRTDTDLPNQIAPVTGAAGGYRQTGYGLGYNRAIGRNLTLNSAVSHVDIQPLAGTLGKRSGVNLDLGLTLQLGEQLQLVGTASRKFSSTLTSNATYELDQNYGLTANYAVNPQLRFHLGGFVAPRQFFYATTPVGPFIGRQTQKSISGGASYSFARRMRLTVDSGYDVRDADLNLFDYKAFYTSVGLSITF